MSTLELFIIAVGLSMDAFAVAVCKGLSVKDLKPKHMLIVGLYFGAFQGLMPLGGYFLGKQFEAYITASMSSLSLSSSVTIKSGASERIPFSNPTLFLAKETISQ